MQIEGLDQSPRSASARQEPFGRIRSLSERTRTGIAVGAVLVIALILLLRRSYAADVSPFDEGYHLSYLQYVHSWSIPKQGDPMGSWSEQMYACRSTYPYGATTQVPCGVDGPSNAYPEGGQNTAAGWPPIYYIVAVQLMRPLLLLGAEPMLAGRTASALLWALGCAAMAYVVIQFSGSRVLGVAAGVLGASIPSVWALGAYVSPHSTAMLVGVGVLALLLWGAKTVRPVWQVALVAAGVAVVAQLTLPHSIVAICAISVAATALAWSRPDQRVQLVTMAGALFAVGVVTYSAWVRVVNLRASGDGPSQPSTPPEGLRVAITDNWDQFWPRSLGEIQFLTAIETQSAMLITYGSIALVGYWILSGRVSEQRSVALGLIIGAPIASVAFALLLDFVVPMRYGASIVPLVLFLLALPSASRAVKASIGSLAVVSAAMAFASAHTFMVLR